MSVPTASAIARRHSSQPSLAIPSQSTATNTIGLAGTSKTRPRGDSGSTIFAAGLTPAAQHSGEPKGGVTSTWKVAMRSLSSARAVNTKVKNKALRRKFIFYKYRLIVGDALSKFIINDVFSHLPIGC